jgi:hypothetical protein
MAHKLVTSMQVEEMLNLDTLKDGLFHVWQPNAVGLIKSGDTADRWHIGGYASTEELDRQGEQVLQKGLDFAEFIEHGWFNDNHQQHTAAAIGVPELAEYKKGKGWYTEGYLLKNVARAVEVYTLAKSLEAEAPHRKLGFSIEGKILERLGNKIVRALIRNVAVTNSPVNTGCTWGLVAKSFADEIEEKALSVGHARSAESGGRVLVPEDLEKDEIKYIYYCSRCKKAFGSTVGLEDHIEKSHQELLPVTSQEYPTVIRRTAKSLTREQAIEYLRHVRPQFSEDIRTRLVDYTLSQAS